MTIETEDVVARLLALHQKMLDAVKRNRPYPVSVRMGQSDLSTVLDAAVALERSQSLSDRIAELEGENARLSKAVCSDVLGGLLTEDENEALVTFVKELRRASLIKEGSDAS